MTQKRVAMSKLEEYTSRLRSLIEPDIITNDDGYKIWWPAKLHCYFAAHDLRIIADYLDELNAAWDAEVNAFFESQK